MSSRTNSHRLTTVRESCAPIASGLCDRVAAKRLVWDRWASLERCRPQQPNPLTTATEKTKLRRAGRRLAMLDQATPQPQPMLVDDTLPRHPISKRREITKSRSTIHLSRTASQSQRKSISRFFANPLAGHDLRAPWARGLQTPAKPSPFEARVLHVAYAQAADAAGC